MILLISAQVHFYSLNFIHLSSPWTTVTPTSAWFRFDCCLLVLSIQKPKEKWEIDCRIMKWITTQRKKYLECTNATDRGTEFCHLLSPIISSTSSHQSDRTHTSTFFGQIFHIHLLKHSVAILNYPSTVSWLGRPSATLQSYCGYVQQLSITSQPILIWFLFKRPGTRARYLIPNFWVNRISLPPYSISSTELMMFIHWRSSQVVMFQNNITAPNQLLLRMIDLWSIM